MFYHYDNLLIKSESLFWSKQTKTSILFYMNQKKYWTAFYTKPKNERKVAERLASIGIELYVPLKTTIKQWSDRKKKVQEPLFRSYVFAEVDEKIRLAILQDSGVIGSVMWLKKPVSIPEDEIQAIRNFIQQYPNAVVSENRFRAGDEVEVKVGAMSGAKGAVKEIRSGKAIIELKSMNFILKANQDDLSKCSSLETQCA